MQGSYDLIAIKACLFFHGYKFPCLPAFTFYLYTYVKTENVFGQIKNNIHFK